MSDANNALLVAVHDSEASGRTFDFAARQTDRLNTELHLVHVVQRQLSMQA
jgi:K+-sensing histidine kinase KdpD